MCCVCFSCTKETTFTSNEKYSQIKLSINESITKSVINVNEESVDSIPEVNAFEVYNQTMIPLAETDVIPLSYTGYQTFKSADPAPQYLGISKEVAASLGLDPTRTYQCTRYEAKIRAGIKNGLQFVQLPSPQCGYVIRISIPYQRGYTWEPYLDTESVIMTTSIYKCIQDSKGQIYNDLWIPCKKENIVWDFGVI